MAIQTLSTIKNWFRTNLKPTQSQFWDTWDSFRHKNEKVAVEDLDGIDELLQNKVEREVFDNHLTDPNAHAESFSEKLDKGGYNGTGKDLDDRITAIEIPDRILKFGALSLSGLNLTIAPNAFAWVVNKLQFLTPDSYSKTLTAATSGMYRTDIVVGNQSGSYEVITGAEAATGTAAAEPLPPTGTIKLGFISLLGNTVANSGSIPAIEKSTIVDADRIVIDDSETSFARKSVKFLNIKAALKAYFDGIYQSFMGIVNVTGTTYQLLFTDNGKKIMCTSATAVALTIPTNAVAALPIGAKIKVTQQGDGVITFTTTGLTIVSSSPLYTIKGQTVTLEKTAINTWTIEGNNLNGEIRLAAYPSTRNDGQLLTNKVLGTDINGNLKMYTIATSPAPFLEQIMPSSYLPSTTGDLILKGSFFTPTMTATIQGQTVNYITFVSDNEVRVNITTGATEGSFNITLDNGLSRTFSNALLIILGTIHKPIQSDFTVVTGNPNTSIEGEFRLNLFNVACSADFFVIPPGQNFRVYATLTNTSLNSSPVNGGPNVDAISLLSTSDNLQKFAAKVYLNGVGIGNKISAYQASTGFAYGNDRGQLIGSTTIIDEPTFYFERIGTEYRLRNSTVNIVFTDTFNGTLKIRVYARYFDLKNLKYVELPS